MRNLWSIEPGDGGDEGNEKWLIEDREALGFQRVVEVNLNEQADGIEYWRYLQE